MYEIYVGLKNYNQVVNKDLKQAEIIELIIQGLTYKEIATKLLISPKTVDNHVQNIYKKLNVNSKMQLSHLVHSNAK